VSGGRRIRVIWNATAGSKAGIPTNTTDEGSLRDLMARHGLGDELVATSGEEEAIAVVREARDAGYDVVVAAGGDGTTALVARELLGTPTALGVLPLGSVMNISRMLELPRELEAAAAVIATGATRRVDVGKARSETFFEAGNVGLNAAIFRQADRVDRGHYPSLLTAIWIMLRYRGARMTIQLDDEEVRTRALMVSVANGPYTGLGFTVAPGARLDDGRFDVRVFGRFSKWELVRHFLSIALGRRRYEPRVETYHSAHVRVTSAHPLPCRADSLDLGTTPVDFEVLPGALCVVATNSTGAPAEGAASS
jgi:diacylglycerol kinase family enzyme